VVASSLLDLIGNTPLVELAKLSPPGRTIYAKLEGQNPTGSIKDRVALAMVEAADLKPGQELLEPTSGNTGISLALVAKLKGLKLTCVMPANATPERRTLLELYGATIIDSPGELGSNGAVQLAQEIAARDDRYVMLFQYGNEANPRAHYEGTGPELWRQTEGRLTHFVSSMGTTGTIMGVSKYLKEQSQKIEIIGAQPEEGSRIPGIRKWPEAYLPKIFDRSRVDRVENVSQAASEAMARRLASVEGIFAGISSGGACEVALRIARQVENATIVFIVCDRGDRYLSTGVFPA